MTTLVIILAVILGFVGLIGCVLPVLPGPPISWIGMLLIYIFSNGTNSDGEPMSTRMLIIWLIITIVVTVMDYIVPSWVTRKTGGSVYASRGALAGLLLGLFVPPIGILIGPVLGALLAELALAGKNFNQSIKPALGAFLGVMCGTGLKLIASGFMLYYIFVYLR
ncbi:MAG: DUF456 domain-containing protein [Bacteroidales bacterium]|nr:DUF456 domain-containing protein [Bacteroidales bacterium]